eukprot:3300545-Pyramimonas_sp.AAC.1
MVTRMMLATRMYDDNHGGDNRARVGTRRGDKDEGDAGNEEDAIISFVARIALIVLAIPLP